MIDNWSNLEKQRSSNRDNVSLFSPVDRTRFRLSPSSIAGIVGTSTTIAIITGFLLMTALAGIRQNQEWFHICVASIVLTLLVSLATFLAGQNADNGFSFSVSLGLRALFGFNILFFAAATAGYAFSLLTRKETV